MRPNWIGPGWTSPHWTRQERVRFQIVLVLAALDAVLLAASPMRLAYASLLVPLATACVLTGLGAGYRQRREEGLAATLIGTAQLIAFTAAAASLNYLLVPLDRPLYDAVFHGFDRALGIHWPSLFAALKVHTHLGALLSVAYMSSLLQVALMVPLLGLLRRTGDLDLFLLAFMGAALAAIGFWAVFPSFGAGPHLYATGEMTSFPGAMLGEDYARTMLALKAGQIRDFSLSQAEGLIGFPSFHTVMAVLTVHAVRGVRRVFWPALAWNALVMASIPVEGAHNVCDVIAGIVLAVAAIALAGRALEADCRAVGRGAHRPAVPQAA